MHSAPEIDNHVYLIPSKLIKTEDDMQHWQSSEAYYEYLGFIYTLNDSIKGKTNEEASADASPEITKVCKLLDILESWIFEVFIDEYEENSHIMAFREWYGRLRDGAIRLLQEVVPEVSYRAIPEIMVYLIEGFGNSVRCDYGTGHELSFLMFLCSLFKIGFLKVTDGPATACKVFVRYLEVVRKLQGVFKMDSIGSHGAWSLDDYQFVPFIWGSSQLIGNPADLDPACFLKASIIKKHSPQYMFFSCIDYIKSIKPGPFAEHSNQLWNVSGVSSWSKVNSGLTRMYQADVLLEFPLVKNVYFGSIFTLNAVEQGASIRRPLLSTTSIHKPPTNVEFSSELPSNRKTLTSFQEKSSSDPDRLGGHSKDAKQVNIDNDVFSEIESEISVDKNSNTQSIERNQTVNARQNSSYTSIKEEKRITKISVEFLESQKDKASVSKLEP